MQFDGVDDYVNLSTTAFPTFHRISWSCPESCAIILIFQRVTHIVSHQLTRLDDLGVHMGNAAQRTRHNRTIAVDFQDEATYVRRLDDGKAFVECVVAFLFSFGF
jgi:hypothetical protein